MGNTYDLAIAVKANTLAAQSQLETVDKTINSIKKSTKNLGNSLTSVGNKLSKFGKNMSLYVTAPLVLAAGASVKFALSLNKGMANVATLIPHNTKRINELKDSVKSLSVETGKSFKDMTGGLYQVISAYGDADDTVQKLAITAKTASAGLATTEQALNLLSAVTKAYGDTSAKAQQKVADLAFETVKLGQTTFPELASSIQKVTAFSKTLGVSQKELFNVYATLTGVTGNAAEVSTQLKSALQALLAPTEDMKNLYKSMGVASGKALISQKGLHGALIAVVDAAKKTGKPLQKYIRQIRGATLAMALTGAQSDVYEKKLVGMSHSIGAQSEAFKEQTQGINAVGFSMEQTKMKAEVLASEWGDKLLPVVNKLLDKIDGLVTWMSKLTDNEIDTILQMGFFAVSIGPVTTAIGGLTKALAFLVANPIVAGIAAVIALTAVVVILGKKAEAKHIQKLADQFGAIADSTGVAKDKMVAFGRSAENADRALSSIGAPTTFKGITHQVDELSKNLGLSKRQVIEIGLQSKTVTSAMRDQLKVMKKEYDQVDSTQKAYAQYADARRKEVADRITAKNTAIATAKAAKDEAADQARITEEFRRQQELIRVKKVITGRKQVLKAYDKAISEGQTKFNLGLITQDQLLSNSAKASKTYIDSLISLGYDGVNSIELGDKALRNQIKIYNKLVGTTTTGSTKIVSAGKDYLSIILKEKDGIQIVDDVRKASDKNQIDMMRKKLGIALSLNKISVDAYLKGISILDDASTKLVDSETDRVNKLKGTFLQYLGIVNNAYEKMGGNIVKIFESNDSALVKTAKTTKALFDGMKEGALDAVSSIIKSFGQQFAVKAAGLVAEAIADAATGNFAGAAAAALAAGEYTAASIGAYTAAGAVKAFGNGTDFVTNGPQTILVGDNASGRERVRIDPQPDTRNNSGGNIYITVGDVYGVGGKDAFIKDVVNGVSRIQRTRTI